MKVKAKLLDSDTLKRSLMRMSHEIIEKNINDIENVVLIGIMTRGVPIAVRIAENISAFENVDIKVGILDITLYRDDLSLLSDHPIINGSDIPFSIEHKHVVLVDDVLYTGRTVRAAIEAVMQIGRPKSVQLAVLVDRGHRELPIRADFVGRNIPTSRSESVAVHIKEIDGSDGVELLIND